jgi:hypothetical protein
MTTVVLTFAAWAATLAAAQTNGPSPRTPTPAQVDEATGRFQRGTEMFEEQNLPGALAEFRRAYALAPSYRILYNIGQICYLMRDYPCALDSFSRYLAEGGADIPGPRQTEVQRDLARLQARVARVRVVVDRPGAEISVDDVVVGRSPLAEPVLVAAGRPKVGASMPGHAPASKVVEVAALETATVALTLQPLTAGPPSEPLARERAPDLSLARSAGPRAPVTPWVVTGALAAAAGAAGALALWSSSELKNRRSQFGVSQQGDLSSRASRTRNLALATDILLGATVVAAGISTYLTVFRSDGSTEVALVRRF